MMSLKHKSTNLIALMVIGLGHFFSHAFVPLEVRQRWKDTGYTFEEAIKTVEESVDEGEGTDELYYAVRFIDRQGHKFYNTMEEKEALKDLAMGSWELRLAYEDNRSTNFYPYPDFRDFAMAVIMVEPKYFGKTIAQNSNFSYVAMGGPATFDPKKRQLFMNYVDFFISGQNVPEWDLSYFMRGYARNWYADQQAKKKKKPPLAFTLIAASEKVLVVRGSKTGGMAIFRRLDEDMREAAYGGIDRQENSKNYEDMDDVSTLFP